MAPEFSNYVGLPLIGTIRTDGGSRVLHVSSGKPKDSRDVNSFYAATSSELQKPVIFLFDPEAGGLLLQAVENRSDGGRGKTDGMCAPDLLPHGVAPLLNPQPPFQKPKPEYLAVHDFYGSDRIFPGFLRIIVHRVAAKAAVWEFVKVFGKTVVRIKANRDDTGGGTINWYLAVPPSSVRDEVSNYLAVTPDVTQAMPVSVVALPQK